MQRQRDGRETALILDKWNRNWNFYISSLKRNGKPFGEAWREVGHAAWGCLCEDNDGAKVLVVTETGSPILMITILSRCCLPFNLPTKTVTHVL